MGGGGDNSAICSDCILAASKLQASFKDCTSDFSKFNNAQTSSFERGLALASSSAALFARVETDILKGGLWLELGRGRHLTYREIARCSKARFPVSS
ncbi:hypothetical protein O181_088889 [Austropuccinia psidii MF-1]|uniref:Uncharacterized protein n=1 Tax=Austropuccinia psidii MF-1 TaxID=1389203 RepID=A0A9Q3ISK7_9BASI|nr:hypothetical protein [Austropuccinia psidii MF-1]